MLKETLQQDLKNAMKQKKQLETDVLRMVLSEILNQEKQKRYKLIKENPELNEQELQEKSELANQEIIQVLSSEAKKRKDSIEQFEKGGRYDLAQKEKQEAEILKKYLPEQLPESEIKKLAQEVIQELGAESPKDMGKVIAQLMPKLKGKADGSMVSKAVKDLLS